MNNEELTTLAQEIRNRQDDLINAIYGLHKQLEEANDSLKKIVEYLRSQSQSPSNNKNQ